MPSPPLQDPAALPSPPDAQRQLGFFDAACIVIGAIIGVGIFFSPGNVVRLTGSGDLALIAWALGGAVALCGALTFAELGSRYTSSAAQFRILRDTYGSLPSFLFVFCNATAVQTGAIAIIAVISAQNLAVAAGRAPPEGIPLLAVSVVLIACVAATNIAGIRWGARVQNLTVIAKVFTLIAITVLAAFVSPGHVDAALAAKTVDNLHPPSTTPAKIAVVLAGLVPVFFSFGGWQHALWISGRVTNPARTLPRAIIAGVLVVVAVYLLANWAYLHLLSAPAVAASKALAADAVSVVFPSFGSRAVAAAVALSAFGVLNAQFLSGPHLVVGLARDSLFYSPFARTSARGAPVAAILLMAVIAVLILLATAWSNESRQNLLDPILNGVIFIDSGFFALTGLALILIRMRRGSPVPFFRAPLFPLVPAIFVLGQVGALVGTYLDEANRRAAAVGGVWVLLAAILFALHFRKPRSAADAPAPDSP